MKMRDTALTLAVGVCVLFVAITNVKLVLLLVGAILAYALISRMCGPMGEELEE
jgi:hypothetical protein